MNKQKWEKMMVEVEEVETTLDFSKMTDKELMQKFNYWKETAEHRMRAFATKYQGTASEDKAWKDYQLADTNAQSTYLEMNEGGL